MPFLFRVVLFGCVTGLLAFAIDFPVGQLIRSDVQDLYNPETRFGVRYGTYPNAEGRVMQEPANNPSRTPNALGLSATSALNTQLGAPGDLKTTSNPSTVVPARNTPAAINQPGILLDSGYRQVTLSEVPASEILNGWSASLPQTQATSNGPTITRFASLQFSSPVALSPLIASFSSTQSAGASLQTISNLVLSPLHLSETGQATTPNSTTPLVTATTPTGETYPLGSSPSATQIVHPSAGTAIPTIDPIPSPNLGTTLTPEPSSILLALTGLLAGIAVKRRS